MKYYMKRGIMTTLVMLIIGLSIVIMSCKAVDGTERKLHTVQQNKALQKEVATLEWKQYHEDQRTTMKVLLIVVVPINIVLFLDLVVRIVTSYTRKRLNLLKSATEDNEE